ncbi:MAG: hypothetical protein JJU00_14125, partial [Opitutales bacterium]|nr:hypothetical protein [Opitutales bacterium]
MVFFAGLVLMGIVASVIAVLVRNYLHLLRLIPQQVLLFFIMAPMFTIFTLSGIEFINPLSDEVTSSGSLLEPALIMLVVACLLFGGFFLRAL